MGFTELGPAPEGLQEERCFSVREKRKKSSEVLAGDCLLLRSDRFWPDPAFPAPDPPV